MARRRYVSTEISDDDGLAELVERKGYFAALLYTWLIPHADDRGTFTGNAKKLLGIAMPQFALIKGKKAATAAEIGDCLEVMAELGLIVSEGTDYYFPPRVFYRYQTYIPEAKRRVEECASALSGENADDQREITEIGENAAYPSPSPSVKPSFSPSVVVVEARDEISEIVADFAKYGTVNALTVGYVEDAVDEYTLDWVRRAVDVGAKGKASGGQPPWSYIENTLKRWRDEGEPDDDKPRLQTAGRAYGPRNNGVHYDDLEARAARL